MAHISFNGVRHRAATHKLQLLERFSQVVDSGIYLHGKQQKELINRLTTYYPNRYILPVASGHDALALALSSLKITPKDEVLFPVNAYPTAFPVMLSGARPVPVDVDQKGQIDIDEVEKHISSRTKAIITVHLYGMMGDIEKLSNLARSYGVALLEDCAQSFGSTFNDKYAGTFGDIACLSFYPTKNLATLGDGGVVLTKNYQYYLYCQQAASYGEKKQYKSTFISGHSRLSELQAAALNVFFDPFKQEVQKRRICFSWYQKSLKTRTELAGKIEIIEPHKACKPVYHVFAILTKKRSKLQRFLSSKGIPTLVHYPKPVHKVRAFSLLVPRSEGFPNAERFCQETLSLPFHPYLTRKEIDYIVESMYLFYKKL